MTTLTIRPRKLAELEVALPGFVKIWKKIQADTGTKKRCPSTVTFVDEARAMYMNDSSCGRRYALDLVTMTLSEGRHVSAGEWAVGARNNPDKAVTGVANGQALISCEWNDYYHSFMIEIQVAVGALPKELAA